MIGKDTNISLAAVVLLSNMFIEEPHEIDDNGFLNIHRHFTHRTDTGTSILTSSMKLAG